MLSATSVKHCRCGSWEGITTENSMARFSGCSECHVMPLLSKFLPVRPVNGHPFGGWPTCSQVVTWTRGHDNRHLALLRLQAQILRAAVEAVERFLVEPETQRPRDKD